MSTPGSGRRKPAVCYIEIRTRMKRKVIAVQSSAGRYAVVCGAGILRRAAQEISALGKFSSVHVVSSPKVWRSVGKTVQRGFAFKNSRPLHLFDDSEAAKNLGTVESLARSLSRAGADRESLIVAVGGGVVGDVAGFVAATYLRGQQIWDGTTVLSKPGKGQFVMCKSCLSSKDKRAQYNLTIKIVCYISSHPIII